MNPKVQEEIKSLKEEQYQGEFLEDLFVKILGYTKPASSSETPYNLTTEYKNVKDSKKADGAIIIDTKVKAVIELKGTNTTDLGKIEVQAFGYKNNQPECVYVITSNFEKLRFYIDNAIEHIEFNLFTLTQEDFSLLYLCLGYENIANDVAKKIKAESLSEEDVITKKLYKDYSIFKRELYQSLVALNPAYEPLELFKKSQKLLDRFLFLLFGEDRNLLPPNSVKLILSQWNQLRELDEYTPLYDRFKKYFGYLNTGYKGKQYDVFAYNGGLFKPDGILDSIIIDDDLLYTHTLKLSEYDFSSEVDVNILGHIFENSLNELDEIKAQLEGAVIDKSKTKRKKDGVFYTPKYITKYIVENTVGKLCTEKKAALEIIEEEYYTDKKRQKKTIKGLIDKLEEYRKWLLQVTIIDPACGSGAFLNEALNFLIAEHTYVDELQAKLFGDAMVLSDVEKSILENNLFGVDLNEESVEIAKLSLWLRTAQPNRKLNDLNSNIKCGNSLIDDPEIAGDKAFNWRNEFPKVFEKGGFDVVIGNPPYGVSFNEIEKRYLSNFDSLVPDFEIYIYFISLYKIILKNNSVLSYIFPNTFLSTLFGIKYRETIFKNLQVYQIIDLSNDNTFVDASVRTCIFSFRNKVEDYTTNLLKVDNREFKSVGNYNKNDILGQIENILSLFSQNSNEKLIINKLQYFKPLKDFYEVSQGLIPYDKYRGHDEYTIKNRIWHSEFRKDNTFKQELKGGDINRYNIEWNGKLWISYGEWLAAPRKIKFFTSERILIREIISGTMFCGYTDLEYYNTPSAINIINDLKVLELKYSLSILNSKLLGWFVKKTSPKANKGLFPKILVNDIKNIPLVELPIQKQQPFIEKTDLMLSLNTELKNQSQKFQRAIQRKFELEDLPKKLQDWYKLTYPEFIKELAKKKVKLSLSQEAEWEDYFMEESKKVLELKSQIDATDKAIDTMVYELYGLSKEEIKIVEKS
uniref:Eco57I restriction-modification methylase domain-containing protein n=1 Tax=Flavobacterium xanthum TaxID=69322 RepID=UPI001FE39E7D|nr:TaqI-like C-terminal specificity domain-containing protein [Flavobacterium xanthum]